MTQGGRRPNRGRGYQLDPLPNWMQLVATTGIAVGVALRGVVAALGKDGTRSLPLALAHGAVDAAEARSR